MSKDAAPDLTMATDDIVPPARVDICRKPGCTNELPQPHHPMRKYCDEHQPSSSHKRDKKPGNVGGGKVVIEMGTPGTGSSKKDKELQAVEDRAKQIGQMIAAIVLMAGQPEDANDLVNGIPRWAASVKDLAEHEAWLRKIAAGGEVSARAMAWLNLAIATVAMILPILLRHDALPANITNLASTFLGQPTPTPADADANAA